MAEVLMEYNFQLKSLKMDVTQKQTMLSDSESDDEYVPPFSNCQSLHVLMASLAVVLGFIVYNN